MFYACFMLIGSWEGGKNFRVGIVFWINSCQGRVTGNKQLFFRPKRLMLQIDEDCVLTNALRLQSWKSVSQSS